jgi:hypothetical protein
LGLILVEEFLGVALVSGGIFGGQKYGAASEAVGQSVEGGAEFTGAGAGPGRVLRVGAVAGGAVRWGTVDPVGRGEIGHWIDPFDTGIARRRAAGAAGEEEVVDGIAKKAGGAAVNGPHL